MQLGTKEFEKETESGTKWPQLLPPTSVMTTEQKAKSFCYCTQTIGTSRWNITNYLAPSSANWYKERTFYGYFRLNGSVLLWDCYQSATTCKIGATKTETAVQQQPPNHVYSVL